MKIIGTVNTGYLIEITPAELRNLVGLNQHGSCEVPFKTDPSNPNPSYWTPGTELHISPIYQQMVKIYKHRGRLDEAAKILEDIALDLKTRINPIKEMKVVGGLSKVYKKYASVISEDTDPPIEIKQ